MKKVIAAALLALVMATSLFASLPSSSKTNVILNLAREASYTCGITTEETKATEETTSIKNVDSIALSYDKDSRTIGYSEKGTTYYVSYRFYEWRNVDLKMALSGDMTVDGKETTDSSKKISYYVSLGEDGKVIPSSDTEAKTIATFTETDVKGDTCFDNIALTVASDDTIEGKSFGSYSATITLSVIQK